MEKIKAAPQRFFTCCAVLLQRIGDKNDGKGKNEPGIHKLNPAADPEYTNCGNESPKWQGRCPACGAWNTYEEHIEKPTLPGKAKSSPVGQSRKPQRIQDVTTDGEIRFSTGMGELDRVLGGGAVAGSLVLVGGAPGIGKSTLLLQICNSLCAGRSVLYVSGEESERQLKLRAQRLGVAPESLYILSETRLSDILEAVEELKPDILMIDSIQTL